MIEEKFAQMFKKARESSGKSQEYMAKALDVSKRTIQNWESGYSSPSQLMGFKWFEVLGLQPLPFYLEILYPEFEDLTADSDDTRITEALIALVKDMPNIQQRKMLYLLSGVHGGSPVGILELLVAHLHTPIEMRLSVAQNILINYEISEAQNKVDNHIKPNLQLLEQSIKYAKDAAVNRNKSYSNMKGEK